MSKSVISRNALLYFSLLLLVYGTCLSTSLADNDIWARMAVGSYIFQNHDVPREDLYSYMPTKPLWIDHEWGSGLVFYGLYRFLGEWSLVWLQVLASFAVIAAVDAANRLLWQAKSATRIYLYALTILGIVPGMVSTVRSQVFTYVLFAAWIFWLEKLRRGDKRYLFLFPITFIPWVNLHGGFLAGLALIGVFIMGELLNRRKPLLLAGLLLGLLPLALINPYGFDFVRYMGEAALMPRPGIDEWGSLLLFDSFFKFTGFKIFLLLTLICVVTAFIRGMRSAGWWRLGEWDMVPVILLSSTLFSGLKHMRHSVFFVIAASVYLYPHLSRITRQLFGILRQRGPAVSSRALLAGTLVLLYGPAWAFGLYELANKSPRLEVTLEEFPVGAVRYIQEHKLRGNLLLPLDWGSYALWMLYPDCLVGIDGRYEEVYPNEVYHEVLNFFRAGRGWRQFLDKYPHDMVLVWNDIPINLRMRALPDWQLVYRDSYASLFLRRPGKKFS